MLNIVSELRVTCIASDTCIAFSVKLSHEEINGMPLSGNNMK